MSEPCFDTLRTKEQLGYDVFSMIRNTYGVIGVSITVNSQVNVPASPKLVVAVRFLAAELLKWAVPREYN